MIPSPPFNTDIENQIYGLMMGGDALAFESVAVGYATLAKLTIPVNAAWIDKVKYCMVLVEADPTAETQAKAIRWVQVNPASGTFTVNEASVRAQGFPFGDAGVFEVKGLANMQNLRLIGLQFGKAHTIRVEYYG